MFSGKYVLFHEYDIFDSHKNEVESSGVFSLVRDLTNQQIARARDFLGKEKNIFILQNTLIVMSGLVVSKWSVKSCDGNVFLTHFHFRRRHLIGNICLLGTIIVTNTVHDLCYILLQENPSPLGKRQLIYNQYETVRPPCNLT